MINNAPDSLNEALHDPECPFAVGGESCRGVKARGLDMLVIFDKLQRREARNMDDLTSSLLFGLDGS